MDGCKLLIIIGLLSTATLPAMGQSMLNLTREQLDSIMNPKPLVNGDRIIKFDSKSCNIGTVDRKAEPIACTFPYISEDDITITGIKTTCGCTEAKFDSEKITLIYSPEKDYGMINVKAYVYTTASSSNPTAILNIVGSIEKDKWDHLPYSIGTGIKVKRKRVTFHSVTPTQKREERIPVANVGDTPIEIFATKLPEYATFRTEPTVIKPGEEGDMVITIKGEKLPKSSVPEEFSILIEGTSGQEIERTIKVTIEK